MRDPGADSSSDVRFYDLRMQYKQLARCPYHLEIPFYKEQVTEGRLFASDEAGTNHTEICVQLMANAFQPPPGENYISKYVRRVSTHLHGKNAL